MTNALEFPAQVRFYVGTDNNLYAFENQTGKVFGISGGAAGPPASTAAPDITTSLYYSEDFDTFNFVNANTAGKWIFSGSIAWAATMGDHYGVIKLSPGGNGFMLNASGQASTQPGDYGINFSSLTKAIVRWVVMADHSPETSNYEWWCGFMNNFASQQYGALFSAAQGYTGLPNANGIPGNVDASQGLVVATYNNVAAGHYGYLQSLLQPAANQWLDLIVVWTPTQNRFYAAPYGQTPVLVGAINNNIVSAQSTYPAIMNASNVSNLYLDRCEILYQSANPRFMAGNLLNL